MGAAACPKASWWSFLGPDEGLHTYLILNFRWRLRRFGARVGALGPQALGPWGPALGSWGQRAFYARVLASMYRDIYIYIY